MEDGIPMVLVYTEFSKQNVNFKVPFSKNNKVLGIFKGPDKEETSKVNRPQTPKPPYSYKTEDVTITNPIDKNLLAGTLTIPQNYSKNIPIYVLITGSGNRTGIVSFTIINLLLSLPIIWEITTLQL